LHVAVGMNNVVVYYRYASKQSGVFLENAIKENEQEYLGKVNGVCLNRIHTAVLSGGRVSLHEIVASSSNDASGQRKTFPLRQDSSATAVALTFIAIQSNRAP
jgi:hypothetical protein